MGLKFEVCSLFVEGYFNFNTFYADFSTFKDDLGRHPPWQRGRHFRAGVVAIKA